MEIKGSKAWVRYLDTVELPVLSKTLKSISIISASDDIKIDELVKVILNDADLTSKVLKLANSVCYNPMKMPVSTMSRAIVKIGFESIKSIAISSALVDQLVKRSNQQQLFNCLIRSFHAAIQAKYMASDFSVEEQEAIFIAALLFDIGEAAFWSSSSPLTSVLEDRVNCHGHQFIDDQKEVLGTSFKLISRGLIKAWHLGPLLEESTQSPSSRQARIVCAAVELARKYDHGWHNENLAETLTSTAILTGKSDSQIKNDLVRNAAQAAILAEQLGIKGAKFLLKERKIKRASKPNIEIQFKSLLNISEALSNGASIDKLLTLALESIQKSIGFERCACFIAKENSNCFHIVKSAGYMSQTWGENQALYLKPNNVILKILKKNETQSLPEAEVLTNSDMNLVTKAPFLNVINAVVGSISISGRCRGFVYADRLNQADIDSAQISSFRLFIQQIQMIFSLHRK